MAQRPCALAPRPRVAGRDAMQRTDAIDPPPDETACRESPPPARVVAAQFVDPSNEYRLAGVLRDAAKTRDSMEILSRSAVAFFRSAHPSPPPAAQATVELVMALADLSVTGRAAYASWASYGNAGVRKTSLTAITHSLLFGTGSP